MARDPFDALFDEPDVAINESVKAAPLPKQAQHIEPKTAVPLRPRQIPTDRVHLCDEPGCGRWGAFGLMPGIEVAKSQWWCGAHRPQAWYEAGGETKKLLA